MPNNNVNLHAGHRKRMRERYYREGLDGFAAHEALELLLFYKIPRKNLNELAHTLINAFGSLDAVLSASEKELVEVPGVGEKTASFLVTIGRAARLYATYEENRIDIHNLELMKEHIRRICDGEDCRATWVVCMDKSGRLIGSIPVSGMDRDAQNATDKERDAALRGFSRQVMKATVRNYATIIAIVERCLPGQVEPTLWDIDVCARLASVAGRIGVLLIDMIKVSNDDFVSFRKQNAYNPKLKEADEGDMAGAFMSWLD
ncbi:MAG: helix-hairpin-helix domain-containing protein [Clostridia bacterium]|nr:helix-hairpin-helix domain-containing protein [Clostridia bacterium]